MTYVIAEAAGTWNFTGDCPLNRRRGMKAIEAAAEAGADAVKFQWCTDPFFMRHRRKMDQNQSLYESLKWDPVWHEEFRDYAKELKLDYLCTVYLPLDVAVIAPYVDRFKISSLEALDVFMWRAMGAFPKRIICSTGTLSESDCWDLLAKARSLTADFLQCTASYPCPMEHVNLHTLSNIDGFSFDGLSDHTGHPLTGGLAVAAGATIVEVHFRLDETPRTNPDYGHSHAPKQLREYIMNIRLAERAMGHRHKRLQTSEVGLVPHQVRA